MTALPMSGKKRKPKRNAKIEARRLEKERRRLNANRERLFTLEPGGSPERPIELASAAVISTRAGRIPCPLCAGRLKETEQGAEKHGEELLRRVSARCVSCGAERGLWFRIREPLAN